MKKIKLLLIILLYSLFSKGQTATTCSLIASTNWTVSTSWSCGHIPTGSDNIYIGSNYTVTITTSIDLSNGNLINMTIEGGLFFSGNASKLLLPTTTTVSLTSTGVVYTDVNDNSQKFKIGNNTVWTSNSGSIYGPSIATSTSGQLPIELINFIGENDGNKNILKWSTATEINNNYFLLERSKDAVNWVECSKILGAGNSTSLLKYSYSDYNYLPNEINYYRLSQTDFNGTTEHFKIISIENNNVSKTILKVFNIFGQEINPDSEELRFIIYSDGIVVKTVGK